MFQLRILRILKGPNSHAPVHIRADYVLSSLHVGTLHPYLLAFQRALKLLEHVQFIVSAVDLVFTLDLLENLLPPSGSDHTFDRNRLRKIALDDGKCFDKGLKRVIAAELQGLDLRSLPPVWAAENLSLWTNCHTCFRLDIA